MSKIIGVTVGTPMSVPKIKEKLNMTADEVKFSDGETFQQKYDRGELKGAGGVYVGSGDMPEDCNVQIDTGGESFDLEAFVREELQSGDYAGPAGPAGPAGADGKTPVKGTDYFTEADKQEIVSAVLANFVDVSEVGL